MTATPTPSTHPVRALEFLTLRTTAGDAVLWSSTGSATKLADVGGQSFSEAFAINASGQSVGFSDNASGGIDAVLWSANGAGIDLADVLGPDWTDTAAVAINDQGDILGLGDFNNGSESGQFGFLLTPSSASTVPEPSTWAMLLVGFVGVGWTALRKRKAASA